MLASCRVRVTCSRSASASQLSRPGKRWVAAHAGLITITDLRTPSQTTSLDKDKVVIGSGDDCDLKVPATAGVAAQHVVIEQRREAVFCRSLVGEDMFDKSGAWLNGTEMRPKVGYLLGSGSIIHLGTVNSAGLKVEFQEGSGKNAMLEIMMQGMASSNAEVAKALKNQ